MTWRLRCAPRCPAPGGRCSSPGTTSSAISGPGAAVIPPPGQDRVAIVYDAHKLRRPHELVPLVKAGREAAGAWLLFVSGENDFTRDGDGSRPAPGRDPR